METHFTLQYFFSLYMSSPTQIHIHRKQIKTSSFYLLTSQEWIVRGKGGLEKTETRSYNSYNSAGRAWHRLRGRGGL